MGATFRIPTTVIASGTAYEAALDGELTVGQLARYLSAIDPSIETSTLEIACPIPPARRLHWLNWQPGDRLAIFTRRPRQAEFPIPLRRGDQIVRFSANGLSLTSAGRRTLYVGKPDADQGSIPDVDLRLLLPPRVLDFISRNCLRLIYDVGAGAWFAERGGHTRILLDEAELNGQRVALNRTQQVRFYRASDDPRDAGTHPLGLVQVSVETATADSDAVVKAGSQPTPVLVGLEAPPVLVRASENMQMDQVVTRLLAHQHAAGSDPADAYLLRLVPPDAALRTLSLGSGALLYAAHAQPGDYSLLQLVDVHQRGQIYAVRAEREDRVVLLGWRADGQPAGHLYDLDLQASVVGQAILPFDVFARLRYRAGDGAWWLDPAGQSGAAAFVNSTRLGDSPIPLTAGDVLSFGPSVSHYFARFEVEISTRRA